MEREQQITKLVNVLRQTARSLHGETSVEVVDQALGQYNRVLSTLSESDEELGVLFVPLAEGTGSDVVTAACRRLAAYYRDEVSHGDTPFDADSFRDFWRKSAEDLEDFSDFIRDGIARMQDRREPKAHKNGADVG